MILFVHEANRTRRTAAGGLSSASARAFPSRSGEDSGGQPGDHTPLGGAHEGQRAEKLAHHGQAGTQTPFDGDSVPGTEEAVEGRRGSGRLCQRAMDSAAGCRLDQARMAGSDGPNPGLADPARETGVELSETRTACGRAECRKDRGVETRRMAGSFSASSCGEAGYRVCRRKWLEPAADTDSNMGARGGDAEPGVQLQLEDPLGHGGSQFLSVLFQTDRRLRQNSPCHRISQAVARADRATVARGVGRLGLAQEQSRPKFCGKHRGPGSGGFPAGLRSRSESGGVSLGPLEAPRDPESVRRHARLAQQGGAPGPVQNAEAANSGSGVLDSSGIVIVIWKAQ